MNVMVCFTTAQGSFAIPVEQVRHIFPAAGLAELPDARPHIAGLLRPEAEALPVLSVLGQGGEHILHLDDGHREFGLLVDQVTGVHRLDVAIVRPAPEGQRDELVSGVVQSAGEARLLVDARTIGRTLER